jgi:hypothetical protein
MHMAWNEDRDASVNRSQTVTGSARQLLSVKVEHEVSGKSIEIAAYGLIECFGLHLVKLGEIAIQHYVFAANNVNGFFDFFDGDEVCLSQVRSFREILAAHYMTGCGASETVGHSRSLW